METTNTSTKAEITTAKVTKEFEFTLTEAEKDLKASELAFHRGEEIKEEGEFEEKKQAHKTAMLKHSNNFFRTLAILTSRKETRAVECIMVKDFEAGTVLFTYEGKVMEERPMTSEERQTELKLVTGTKKTGTTETGSAHSTDDSIAQAIREETNARTKHSSVDGPRAPDETL